MISTSHEGIPVLGAWGPIVTPVIGRARSRPEIYKGKIFTNKITAML